ncbi:hypothetical protein [Tahibacter amnicola]|uniref:Uncharacterized protein n=1 Tax=Tahibacter amnicola TaxID=2976241 RepID=A0ABY6BJU3_9GAMM|nr:hypothetical protein [Tahibacter amnicola]UXI70283.1 hypothetical protein N4264_11800 [Tahibacter amnicola]
MGLESLAQQWRDAMSRPEYELPGTTFEQKLINGCAGTIATDLDTITLFALRSALRCLQFEASTAQGERLAEALRANADHMCERALNPADPQLPAVTAVYSFAIGSTLMDGAAPRRDLLRRIGAYYTGKKGKSRHASELLRLRVAADAALLSQNLELFRAVVGLRSSIAIYPTSWPLMQAIAKDARTTEYQGETYLRVPSPELRGRFVQLWQALRLPYVADFERCLPGDRPATGPIVDSYAYGWIYSQSFAPDPIARVDRATWLSWLFG